MIKFKQITWKNFLSYGNYPTTFELGDNTVSMICGKNGAGKSVFVDAMNFVLFGRPYRKIKIGGLVNRTNRKHLLTTITFEKNGVNWKIERGIAPSVFRIFKNDEPLNQQNIRDQQEVLEKTILGFDEKIFRQVVTMGSGYHVAFMKLGLPARREIIEQLFDLDVFSRMKVVYKEKLKEQETKLSETNNQLIFIEKNIENLKDEYKRTITHNNEQKKMIEDKKASLGNSIEEYETKKTDLETKIEAMQSDIESTEKNIVGIDDLKVKISSLEKESKAVESTVDVKYQNEYYSILENKSKAAADIQECLLAISQVKIETNTAIQLAAEPVITKQTSLRNQHSVIDDSLIRNRKLETFYKTNTICPTCKTPLTSEASAKMLKDIQIEIQKNEESIKSLIGLIEESDLTLAKNKDIINQNLKEKIVEQTTLMDDAKINLKNAEEALTRLLETKKKDKLLLVESYKTQLVEINNELRTMNELSATLQKLKKFEQEYKIALGKCTSSIASLKSQIETIDNSIKLIDVSVVDEKLKTARVELEQKRKVKEVQDVIIIYFKHIEKLLSDDGVRSLVVQRYLSILNKKVKEFLTLFGADYSMSFDNTLDSKIFLRNNEELEYDTFSGGEKQRIDLGILFTFMAFSKIKANIGVNILIFDEILDQSLDDEGIDSLMQILNTLAAENDNTIYVISHRDSNYNRFSRIYEVSTKDKMSEVKLL